MGDFNTDVIATVTGGNATAINTGGRDILANLNGDITAESKSRVAAYNVDTTIAVASSANNAVAINLGAGNINVIAAPANASTEIVDERGSINGKITAITEGGNATVLGQAFQT